MKIPLRLCLLTLGFAFLAAGACAAEEAQPEVAEPGGASEEIKSDNPAYAEADAALNEARTNMGDATSARERVSRLESLLARFPDYKYRADLYYYVGLNEQMVEQYDKAVAAFEAALRTEPAIADETPIVSYLKAARSHTFIRRANVVLIALLVVVLLPALWRLTRTDAAALPWGRMFAVYGTALVVWAAAAFLIPLMLGPARAGLGDFPKPTLSDFRIGQIGDLPLRALLAYGAGAILATLPIVAAAACLRRPAARTVLTLVGVVAAVGAVMGLYGIRYLYADAQYNGTTHRLVFLTKSIDRFRDVPDAMLPLYDTNFVKRVMESRAQAAH